MQICPLNTQITCFNDIDCKNCCLKCNDFKSCEHKCWRSKQINEKERITIIEEWF